MLRKLRLMRSKRVQNNVFKGVPGDVCSGPGFGGERAASQTVECVSSVGCDTCLTAGLHSNAESSNVAPSEVVSSVDGTSSGIFFRAKKPNVHLCEEEF